MIKRRMRYNDYVIDNIDWIKQQILKNYDSDMSRDIFIHIDKSSYGEMGYIFFSIEGSPPKGCAVYDDKRNSIIIIDFQGKTKKYNNTFIEKDLLNKIKVLDKLK